MPSVSTTWSVYGLCSDTTAVVMITADTTWNRIQGTQCSIVHTSVTSSRNGHIGGHTHNHGDTGYLMQPSELPASDIPAG